MSAGGQKRPAADEPVAKHARAGGVEGGGVTFEELTARIAATNVVATAPEVAFICTHHGTFHADEAMACTMLKCLPEYKDTPILRTRSPVDIDKADVVVDVGSVYEPARHRYDHHQKTFTETYSEQYPEIKLSSAGLVFKHFGQRVISAICGPIDSKAAAIIQAKTYDTLVRELDALDNGVSVGDNPRYRFVTHLGSRIGRLNPGWQEQSSPHLENARFLEAMGLAATELMDTVRGYYQGWLPARVIVEEALAKRFDVHPSGEVMKLPRFCPWQEHLFDLEAEEEKHRTPLVKYVLFADSRQGWRIQATPKAKGSFENRLPMPRAWRGVRDKELDDLVGVPECVFVHAAGFIGGHGNEAGALVMASKALELAKLE